MLIVRPPPANKLFVRSGRKGRKRKWRGVESCSGGRECLFRFTRAAKITCMRITRCPAELRRADRLAAANRATNSRIDLLLCRRVSSGRAPLRPRPSVCVRPSASVRAKYETSRPSRARRASGRVSEWDGERERDLDCRERYPERRRRRRRQFRRGREMAKERVRKGESGSIFP